MRYEDLYTLDKSGKVRVFKIRVSHEVGRSHIISETGLANGKMVVKDDIVKFGKQGRTVEQQALMMSMANFNSKRDEGYKSRDELVGRYQQVTGIGSQPGFGSDIADIKNLLNYFRWPTSSSWTPLPMLAKPYRKESLSSGYIAQPKLDGVRCIAINKPIRLCSRGGKFYTGLSHIERELEIIFKRYPDHQLDGELYTHGVTQNEISGAARKQNRTMFDDYTWLEYHVYDVPLINGAEREQDRREKEREALLAELGDKLKYIKFIGSAMINSYREAKELHDKYVSDGYEGLILRDPYEKYMFSYRDKCLLKLKAFIEEPFICRGVAMQTGDISTFVLILSNGEGTVFKARAKGSHRLWRRYYDNPPMGREMIVRYINRSAVNNVPEKATVLPLKEYDKWE